MDLQARPKSDPAKLALAARVREDSDDILARQAVVLGELKELRFQAPSLEERRWERLQ
jgi:hypothetical protein